MISYLRSPLEGRGVGIRAEVPANLGVRRFAQTVCSAGQSVVRTSLSRKAHKGTEVVRVGGPMRETCQNEELPLDDFPVWIFFAFGRL